MNDEMNRYDYQHEQDKDLRSMAVIAYLVAGLCSVVFILALILRHYRG